MITHEHIPDFYDWLSRYVQLSNWRSYRDRFAAFTMHKRLDVPTQESKLMRYGNLYILSRAILTHKIRDLVLLDRSVQHFAEG